VSFKMLGYGIAPVASHVMLIFDISRESALSSTLVH
jgi:hypothetical protein